jgi:LuxR family maltose regulon positive regulatory protein
MRPLLQTKLHIPPRRPGLVLRPRLVDRLNAGLPPPVRSEAQEGSPPSHDAFPRALTLLSAPAGFGKTTLLTEWIQQLRLDPTHAGTAEYGIAWLSLDGGDNDPALFLAYTIAALRTMEAGLGEGALSAVLSPQPPPAEAVLIALINDIVALPTPIVLILDDFHLIGAEPIHQAIAFLLEHLPPQMHIVISTREDPHLPFARLRARGQLTELRATDLRFNPAEAAEFLEQAMGLALSAGDIAALEARTEGWIAGLHLAAIALQGLGQRPSSTKADKGTASFIKSFAGSHRYVLDYLIEEVLEQQPESIQEFLLHTSILDRLSGPLCDAVLHGSSGQPSPPSSSGQATLAYLDRANLFVVPLDEQRRWYRYHHLFAELLPALHRRASDWYERNGFADEAIGHALAAEDPDRAAHLLEQHADAMWAHGEHANLRHWLAQLRGETLLCRPLLALYYAWFLYAKGPQDEAEQYLQVAERAPDASHKLAGRTAVIRSLMASYRGDVPALIEYGRQALEVLPEEDLIWRSIAAIALGDAHGFRGDMPAAYQARLEAAEASAAAGSTVFSILAYIKVAITLREQGQLQPAAELCRAQLRIARQSGLSRGSVAGCLMAIWGEVLAELGDLEGALAQVRPGVELAEQGGDWSLYGWSCLCLLRTLFSAADTAAAQALIQKVDGIARNAVLPPWITGRISAWQARLSLAQGDVDAAAQWAEARGLPSTGEPEPLSQLDYFGLMDYLLLARIMVAQGRLAAADGLLRKLLDVAEAGGRTSRVIEILNLQALALQAAGSAEALVSLERALTLAESLGFVRTFVDEGPPMARLLYSAVSRDVAPGYARRLLAAFPTSEPEPAPPAPSPSQESDLLEPLSERELEVLQLVAAGLTNREIASRLYLSLNTVKGHTRNIYGKLGVHSRTQAVARARALGLLLSL